MSCSCTSVHEAYQVAYLVLKGWSHSQGLGWTKAGHTRTVQQWVGGEHYEDRQDEYFPDTQEAYEAEYDIAM